MYAPVFCCAAVPIRSDRRTRTTPASAHPSFFQVQYGAEIHFLSVRPACVHDASTTATWMPISLWSVRASWAPSFAEQIAGAQHSVLVLDAGPRLDRAQVVLAGQKNVTIRRKLQRRRRQRRLWVRSRHCGTLLARCL